MEARDSVLQILRCFCRCLQGGRRNGTAPRADRRAPSAAPSSPSRERTTRAGETFEALDPLLSIQGIGPKTIRYLHEGGYTTVDQVRAASEEDLAAVDGVGPRAAGILKRGLSSG